MAKHWYIGRNYSGGNAINEVCLADEEQFPLDRYLALIGPFHCKACAEFAHANPYFKAGTFTVQDVRDEVHKPVDKERIEEAAEQAWAACMDMATVAA